MSQPEDARGGEGDADHIVEDAFVAVPADRGARTVLRHQRVGQILRLHIRKHSSILTCLEKEGWDFFCLLQSFLFKAVVPAEGDDAPLTEITVELKFLRGSSWMRATRSCSSSGGRTSA